ncbi:MAG: hypothetical protein ACK53Y_19470, partial [bacterium]
MNHDLMRSQLVFDRKCIPTIKELASCIHVKPRSLEALKKSLQFYFSDSYNQTSNASFLNCPKDKGTTLIMTHSKLLQPQINYTKKLHTLSFTVHRRR